MASDENDTAWYLHSQGRRFGPLTEDELRGYYRAGMVKSVDRISVPNTLQMQSAAEVAILLGITPPAGPPPPPLAAAVAAAAPPPAATDAAGAAAGATPATPATPASPTSPATPLTRTPEEQAALDERAAKAIAAMNIDFAALAASSAPRKSSGWLLPVIAGVALIAMLFVALNMLRKMGPGGGKAPPAEETLVLDADTGRLAPADSVPPELRTAPPPQAGASPQAMVPAQGVPGAHDQVWFQRADQLTTLRDWKGLLEHATQWTRSQPERVEAWQALGLANARLGNVDQASAAFERVLLADPTNIHARSVLAEAYLAGQHWAEAADAYKQLVAAAPNDSRLWNNYGVALGRVGQATQAAAALETAVKIDPGFREAWNNLGQVYQAQGDSARAAAAFAQANALR